MVRPRRSNVLGRRQGRFEEEAPFKAGRGGRLWGGVGKVVQRHEELL